MAKPVVDLSVFIEDVRVVVRTENGTYSMSAFPADVRTKDWIISRQKEPAATRSVTTAPAELQWCSLGLLEFMEVDDQIWIEKPRRKQIIFNISMLTPDNVDALQTKIERKHSIRIHREQIQPVALTGFQASIEIKVEDLRRVFFGHVKSLDAIRPLQCVFDFVSAADMQLVLDELHSDEGLTMTCQVSVGGIKFEKTALTIPKQRISETSVGDIAFGSNTDYALFTPSQLDELAQMCVNAITIPEITAAGGTLLDVKPMVVTALQATPVEVTLTPEIVSKVSPINGGQEVLASELSAAAGSEDYLLTSDSTSPISRPPKGLNPSPARAGEKNKNPSSAGSKRSHKEWGEDKINAGFKEIPPPVMSPDSPPRKQGIAGRAKGKQSSKHFFLRVQRSKLAENMTLQWYRLVNPQSAIYSPIEIDTKANVCQYVDKAYRELPRPCTNVSVLRLPRSAWVHFKAPSDSGGAPVESYTVHAQPIVDVPDDNGMIAGAKETREQKYSRRSKISCNGTMSPICVGPLRSDVEYRYAVECHNSAGASRMTDPVLMSARDSEAFATVPLYGIILYSGPVEAIPMNFRKLDGTEPGVPNLTAAFNMKTDVTQPIAPPGNTSSASKGPPWMGLCYIQRIA